jgi:capsular polysaccharide transport system permease protein
MTPSSIPSRIPAARQRPPVVMQRLRVLFALVVREMSTRFGRSWGGYLWAIAEPVGGILLLTLAFSFIVRKPPIGTSFALFYATGIIPFFLFSNVSRSVALAISSNQGLLRYPVVRPLDAVFAKFVTDFLTMFVVGVLLYTVIIGWYEVPVNLDLASIFNGFLLMGLLGLGIGTLNCVLFGFWPTWRNVWNVLTKPLFIMSGMFFTFEAMPRQLQDILWYNPLLHCIAYVRAGFYGGYDPTYVSPYYVLGISGTTFLIGAYLLRRHASALLEQ